MPRQTLLSSDPGDDFDPHSANFIEDDIPMRLNIPAKSVSEENIPDDDGTLRPTRINEMIGQRDGDFRDGERVFEQAAGVGAVMGAGGGGFEEAVAIFLKDALNKR